MCNGKGTDSSFYGGGRSHGVPEHGFNGADGNFVSHLSKCPFHGNRFQTVIGGSAGAVGADVVHFFSNNAALLQRQSDGAGCAFALRMGRRHVVRVTGEPIARHLAVDTGAASYSM